METLDELLIKIEDQRNLYLKESARAFSQINKEYARLIPGFNVGVEILGVFNYYLNLSVESFRSVCLICKNATGINGQTDEGIIKIFDLFWNYNNQIMADMRRNFEKDFRNLFLIRLKREVAYYAN